MQTHWRSWSSWSLGRFGFFAAAVAAIISLGNLPALAGDVSVSVRLGGGGYCGGGHYGRGGFYYNSGGYSGGYYRSGGYFNRGYCRPYPRYRFGGFSSVVIAPPVYYSQPQVIVVERAPQVIYVQPVEPAPAAPAPQPKPVDPKEQQQESAPAGAPQQQDLYRDEQGRQYIVGRSGQVYVLSAPEVAEVSDSPAAQDADIAQAKSSSRAVVGGGGTAPRTSFAYRPDNW